MELSGELALSCTCSSIWENGALHFSPDSTVELTVMAGVWMGLLEEVTVGELTLPPDCHEVPWAQK